MGRNFILKEINKTEKISLRIMIGIGVIFMVLFLAALLQPKNIGYSPFYWILIAAIFYICLKILHEWYHYFSITFPKPLPGNGQKFTVDIFTTYCPEEPYEMVIETLQAIQAINYPHTTYLCDEANDPYLKKICRELNVRHITRNNRKNAKAGNINNALQYASGELCVILDPDHVPAPDFLDHIVPYFNDPEIGYVQIPQAYKNIHESLIAKGAAQQTFQFYGPMMMSMNSYGTVLAIGANCTFRRAALDSIGGHAAGLAEDMHTSMHLHAQGWKSVYIPKVLARGLVPSTLTNYYKQQLKWARGTLELFYATYFSLYKNFTWRQKLHYGTIPFHYMSGLFYLINFIIPILSLSIPVIPFRIDLLKFALYAFPFFTSQYIIRQYVQKWVMEEKERGFHILGGLLQIGTWWIYLVGAIYTLFRKKVNYIPTPKDNYQSRVNNLMLNIPNVLIGILSITAIIYGLSIDWNPYTFVMAGIAGVNLFFVNFMFFASWEKDLKALKNRYYFSRQMVEYVKVIKSILWNLRHGVYAGIRKVALPLLLITGGLSYYLFLNESAFTKNPVMASPLYNQQNFYHGIFNPESPGGLTSMNKVKKFQKKNAVHFDLLSLYIPWGDHSLTHWPGALIDSIYQNKSLPIITWEPWASTFSNTGNHPDLGREMKVCQYIQKGYFDSYIKQFARKLRNLYRPVFLRFAHEPGNPQYPWSNPDNNAPEAYKSAWRHVHHVFDSLKVNNVIWVWSPWKSSSLTAYYPGHQYVDWIGITSLNYGPLNKKAPTYSFKALYKPFHEHPILQSGIPVMLAEFGSLGSGSYQKNWVSNAVKAIKNDFPEIRALVHFNSSYDQNVPVAVNNTNMLNWSMDDPDFVFNLTNTLRKGERPSSLFSNTLNYYNFPGSSRQNLLQFKDVRGINFRKGKNWFKNIHTLTRNNLENDFTQLKSLGINTIKWSGPGIYDKNVLSISREFNLDVHYSFPLPINIDYLQDSTKLKRLHNRILSTIKKFKSYPHIKAWNIGNDIFHQIQSKYFKPEVYGQEKASIAWLKKLTKAIKATDPQKPLTVDLQVDELIAEKFRFIKNKIPEVDAIGLILKGDTIPVDQISNLHYPFYFSQIPSNHLKNFNGDLPGAFITGWQDLNTSSQITFDGLVDHWGRKKGSYFETSNIWGKGTNEQFEIPPVRILKEAQATLPGKNLTYKALFPGEKNGQWQTANNSILEIKFEWHLIKTDQYGNERAMKTVGKGPVLNLNMPENAQLYKLYLIGVQGDQVVTTQSPLNTPLHAQFISNN